MGLLAASCIEGRGTPARNLVEGTLGLEGGSSNAQRAERMQHNSCLMPQLGPGADGRGRRWLVITLQRRTGQMPVSPSGEQMFEKALIRRRATGRPLARTRCCALENAQSTIAASSIHAANNALAFIAPTRARGAKRGSLIPSIIHHSHRTQITASLRLAASAVHLLVAMANA